MIFLIFNNKWATKIVTGLGNPNLGADPNIVKFMLGPTIHMREKNTHLMYCQSIQ